MNAREMVRRASNRIEDVSENVWTRTVHRFVSIVLLPAFIAVASFAATQYMKNDEAQYETINRQLANLQSQILDRTEDRYTGTEAATDQAAFAMQYARDWELQDRRDDRQEETHREDIVRIEGRNDTLAALAQRIMERFGG